MAKRSSSPSSKQIADNYRQYKQLKADAEDSAGDDFREWRRRALKAEKALRELTYGNSQLEKLGAVCSRLNMKLPEEAVRLARHEQFNGRYDDLPLCPIEADMVQYQKPVMLLLGYHVVSKAIERQLIDGVKADHVPQGLFTKLGEPYPRLTDPAGLDRSAQRCAESSPKPVQEQGQLKDTDAEAASEVAEPMAVAPVSQEVVRTAFSGPGKKVVLKKPERDK